MERPIGKDTGRDDPVTRAVDLLRRAGHNQGGEVGAEYEAAADALEAEVDGEERYEPA